MEATAAIVPLTYQCGICMEDFQEDGVVKYCDGKHVFCRECFDEWDNHSSKTIDKTKFESVEHYIHPGDYFRMGVIQDLIYQFVRPVICPICRTTVDSIVHRTLPENYTGTYTKEVSNYTGYMGHKGNYKFECSYLNGKKHGTYKEFLPDGRVQVECEFVNGRLEGHYILWGYKKQKDGKEEIIGKKWDMNYVNGMRDGVCRDWTDIDTLYSEITYKAGMKHGGLKSWYPNGNIQLIMTYDQGNIVQSRQWRSNGTLQSISHYNMGVKCGVHQEFDKEGNLVKEEDFGPIVNPI